LGILASARIRVVPTYNLRIERRQQVFDQVLSDLRENIRRNRNYEFFWFPNSDLVFTKAMNIDDSGNAIRSRPIQRWFNDYLIENGLLWLFKTVHHTLPRSRSKLLKIVRHIVPDSADVQPAHRAYATPRIVKHQEVEYALPLEHAEKVLAELDRETRKRGVQTLMPIEVRFTRRDDSYLSPSSGRDTIYVAVHSFQNECRLEYFQMADEIFREHQGRPHWGKLQFIAPQDLARLYPHWHDFLRVKRELDPEGLFENGWLRRIFTAGESHGH
jgi:FAD/FMN-containing dehydrogenase